MPVSVCVCVGGGGRGGVNCSYPPQSIGSFAMSTLDYKIS